MASVTTIQEQLKVAEAQEAKARAEEVGLKAALDRCRAARAEWSRAAHRLRQQLARASRRDRLSLAAPRRASTTTVPTTTVASATQPPRKPVGRPRIAGCFQCRFLARGGAVGRRGGKAHTCGGPASTEYQHWARVRATVRAQTLAGQAAVGKGEKKSVTGTVKKKVKRAAGGRR